MAIFDSKSRYKNFSSVVQATDRRGQLVPALSSARSGDQVMLGEHLLKEGQRLDHLANYYLQDPNGFWRIAELNDAMLPDALVEANVVKIPTVR